MHRVVIALAIVSFFGIGCSKVDSKPTAEKAAADVAVTPASSKMVIKVPTMSCPHGCWPTVKKTLEEQSGVASVELAKQSDETTIDKPEVTITCDGTFDAPAAIDALSKNGFEGAEVLN